jgi:NitT/TauT family transport system substrate-binding protein
MEAHMTRLAKGLLAAGVGICATLGATASGGAADLVRVGEGPFITGGAFFIAREKGYFKKLNLEIETKRFEDGAFVCPQSSRASSNSR